MEARRAAEVGRRGRGDVALIRGGSRSVGATAFDPDANTQLLRAGVDLAATLGVLDSLILRSTGDLADFTR